jgi:ferredoxin
MASIIPKLKERGLIVIGYDDWYGAGHAQHHEYPYVTDGHPDEIDLQEAEVFGREMVVRSGRISRGETNLIPEVPALKPTPDWIKHRRPFNKYVKYEREKCVYPACRLCIDNCPSNGYDFTVDPPIIATPCHSCGAFCEAICPTGAINADAWFAEIKGGKGGHHYQDGLPATREDEAQGRFRRLVPEDKIGWDTFVYQVYNKHPRWIVGKGRASPLVHPEYGV